MSAGYVFNTVVGAVLLPPLNLILLCALGLWLRRRLPRTGLALSVASLLVLTVLSTHTGASWIAAPLESRHAPLHGAQAIEPDAQAIVVLGGGRLRDAPEYGGEHIPELIALARLRYAATLQRASGLPLLTSGGAPDGDIQAEAESMARVLREDFSVPVRWIEGASDNTAQNAQFSAKLLREHGIGKVVLVTDAIHMPRSVRAFEQAGLGVQAAPTLYRSHHASLPWVPSGKWLHLSHYAMHEWVGMLWYRLRHPPAAPLPAAPAVKP